MQTNLDQKRIINICIGFLGIQIGFALQAANITRILQNYGADLNQLPFFWLVAPLSGMLIQPIIGYISDKWVSNGKTRAPLILGGGILAAACLAIFPNAPYFTNLLTPLIFGAIVIILIDAAFNISMHPLRASISDYLPIKQQPAGFALQTFLISIGAVFGSILPYVLAKYFHLNDTSIDISIPENVKWAFYIGAAILLLTIIINSLAIGSQHKTKITSPCISKPPHVGFLLLLKSTPTAMWRIGVIQFFSWSALFLIWVFMTPAVAQHFYKEYIHEAHNQNYADAANMTGILFGIYHIIASLFALLMPLLYKRWGLTNLHFFALFVGALGLISIYFLDNIDMMWLPMCLLGIAWSSILATPFALVSRHITKERVGIYLGVFNVFITLPQIIIGIIGGYTLKNVFDGKAIYMLVLAGGLMLVSSICCLLYKKSIDKQMIDE